MLDFTCPSCGRQFSTDDSKAGKIVRCTCGTRFQVTTGPPPVAAFAPSDDPPMPDVPIPAPDSFPDRMPYSATYGDDSPEPWFYKYITFIAYFNLIVGLLGLFILFVVFLVALAQFGPAGL